MLTRYFFFNFCSIGATVRKYFKIIDDYIIYTLKKDALFLITNLNHGKIVDNEILKKQIVFFQAQLCSALLSEPHLNSEIKENIFKFHQKTIRENLIDKRGFRNRI